MNLEGTRLGKYELRSEIGRGGMAVVYYGYDPTLDRPVAVKVLPPHLTWEKSFVERFLREARAAAGLAHPNIVTIHDVGQESGWYFFVMSYLEGRPLKDVVQQRGRLPFDAALAILSQLASALDYAHGRGLVHRDVKPANVMIDGAGRATLTDFGLVQAAKESGLTVTGTVMGTPHYMSPEQASGSKHVGPASDTYSLAVMAYEMLCGDVPFDADSSLAILHKHVYEPPPSIVSRCADLPPHIDAVLGQALAKDPYERYESGTAFVTALADALAGTTGPGVTPLPRRAAPSGSRPVTRSPWIWLAGGFVVLALIFGLGLIVLGGGEDEGIGTPPPVTSVPTATAASETSGKDRWTNTPAPTETPSQSINETPPPQPVHTAVSPPTDTPVPPPTDTPVPPSTDTPIPPPSDTPTPTPPYGELVGRIVFTRNPNGHQDNSHEIYVLDLVSGLLSRLTTNNVADWDPSWSPDGQSIAFVSFQAGNYDVWVMNAAGGAQANRIALPSWDDYPAWSPDGSQFAFVSTGEVSGGGHSSQVFVGSNTGNVRQVTFSKGHHEWPAWSPDGQWLAGSSDRDGDMDVYLYTADGGNTIKWTDTAAYDEQPAWSPDGQWIAFIRKDQDTNGNGRLDRRDDGEYGNLWIGRRDGAEFHQLTFDNHAADPAWSPDGRHIVFAHFWDSTGDGWVGLEDASNMWVVPVAGGETKVLLEGPQQDWAPDWTR